MKWTPGTVPERDHARRLWAWLKTHCTRDDRTPQIHLGYGKSDMFAEANALLAEALPADRVFAIPGRHDWRTWKKIWNAFLQSWEPPRP